MSSPLNLEFWCNIFQQVFHVYVNFLKHASNYFKKAVRFTRFFSDFDACGLLFICGSWTLRLTSSSFLSRSPDYCNNKYFYLPRFDGPYCKLRRLLDFFRVIYGPRASRSGHKKTRSVPYSMNLELGLDLELGCRRYISSASCNIHKSHIIFIRASTMRNSLFNPIDLCGVRRFEKWGDNFIILNMFLLHGHCVGTSFLDAWKIYISFSVMRDWSINLLTDRPTNRRLGFWLETMAR